MLDMTTTNADISTQKIGRRAVIAVPSPDRHLLFVTTRGEEAIHEGQIDQPPMFWVVDTQNRDKPPTAYEIGSPFDRVAVAPDNSMAARYFPPAGPPHRAFFPNPHK